jgi:hypothetical protein
MAMDRAEFEADVRRECIVDLTRTSLTRRCLRWRDLSPLSLERIAAPTVRAHPATSPAGMHQENTEADGVRYLAGRDETVAINTT